MTVGVVQHFGGLHPLEAVLVALLAFGPFVALGIVLVLQRRREAAGDEEPQGKDSRRADVPPDGDEPSLRSGGPQAR